MVKNKMALALVLFFAVLCSVFLGYYYFQIMQHPRQLKTMGNPGHRVGSFSFLNQDGKTITEKEVAGKIVVAEFFFTTCEGICPTMNDNMVMVYDSFRNDNELKILSHTVDPKTDTVEQMKRYSLKFDVDPMKWMFLTGNKEKIYDMALNEYLISVADSTVDPNNPIFIHSPYFVLVDKSKKVRGFYNGTKKEEVLNLIKDIHALKK
jgi:protein SCO1